MRNELHFQVSGRPRSDRAFTLIELLVVIAIIALLVSILIPSLQKARDMARTVVCLSQERAQGASLTLYAQDSNGWIPPAGGYEKHTDGTEEWPITWTYLARAKVMAPFDAYRDERHVVNCPMNRRNQWGGFPTSYAINHYMSGWDTPDGLKQQYVGIFCPAQSGSPIYCYNLQKTKRPMDMYLAGDCSAYYMSYSDPTTSYVAFRHNSNKAMNMLFHDGHAKTIMAYDLPVAASWAGVLPWYNRP